MKRPPQPWVGRFENHAQMRQLAPDQITFARVWFLKGWLEGVLYEQDSRAELEQLGRVRQTKGI